MVKTDLHPVSQEQSFEKGYSNRDTAPKTYDTLFRDTAVQEW